MMFRVQSYRTSLNTNVGTSEDGLAYSSNVQSGYKVNDLIHFTQENDQKLLGISDKSNLNFQRDLLDKKYPCESVLSVVGTVFGF